MQIERITKRDDLVIRRLILEPGEAMPWHTDACHRFSVVIRGEQLRGTGHRPATSRSSGLGPA
jgi:quercetin dioxygenase-like cupin family protein